MRAYVFACGAIRRFNRSVGNAYLYLVRAFSGTAAQLAEEPVCSNIFKCVCGKDMVPVLDQRCRRADDSTEFADILLFVGADTAYRGAHKGCPSKQRKRENSR